MSESINSQGSPHSHLESNSSGGSSRPPRSVNTANGGRPPQHQSSEHKSSKTSRRPLPSWCYVPPKEGTSTMKKNVLIFGKTVDVFWCPHHERWDTHRLRECPIEVQIESYKKQLQIFFVSRQEVMQVQQLLVESETTVKNQRSRIALLEQNFKSTGSSDKPSNDEHTETQESNTLQSQLEQIQQELETTRQELLESETKYKRLRNSSRQRNGTEHNVDDLERRLESVEKKSENRKNRILLTESKYKETKERLKEEQELKRKVKKELEEQVETNKRLEQKLATSNESSHSNGHYERREEADKSIYRLSESLATVTSALQSERAARIALEENFAKERKEYEEKLQDAQAEVQRSQMLLTAKRQTSTTSNGSYRSNGNYVKVSRLLVYSHHNVDGDTVKQIQKIASKCSVGGFIKGGKPGLIVVEGLEENCDDFLNNLAKQQRMSRESPRKGKSDSATFAAAGKVISQAETLEEGRAFPQDLTQLDSEGGLDELKVLCASTGMLDLIDEVCSKR